MKRLLSSKLLLMLVVLYGLATVLFSANNLQVTTDEPIYKLLALDFINGVPGFDKAGFPPFAISLGALIPHLFGQTDIFYFRMAHGVIYALGGTFVLVVLWRTYSSLAALLFACLYFFCPNLKAMAALNITDSTAAVFTLLSASLLLFIWRKRESLSLSLQLALFGLASFSQGLALCSKISGLFYLPFIVLFAIPFTVRKERLFPPPKLFLFTVVGVLAFVFAILFAYQFDSGAFSSLKRIFDFQSLHSSEGHNSFLFGKSSVTGFRYYYLAHLLFKLPIITLILLVVSFLCLLKNWNKLTLEIGLTLIPALALLLFLSKSNAQIGLRYFLPGVMLLYLYISVVISTYAKGIKILENRRLVILFGSLLIFYFGIDYRTLTKDSYLSYFNILAPKPTRNFADSNIDWGQGIPLHLRKNLPSYSTDLSFYETMKFATKPPHYVAAGATSLCGFWSERAPLLKMFPTRWEVAGHEIFEVEPLPLFEYLYKQDNASRSFSDNGRRICENQRAGIKTVEVLHPVFTLDSGSYLITFKTQSDLAKMRVFVDGEAPQVFSSSGFENSTGYADIRFKGGWEFQPPPIEWRFWVLGNAFKQERRIEFGVPVEGAILISSKECG